MERTIDDTLEYVELLTRHVWKGDAPAAILALLSELGFQAHMDGFGHLRKAILLRCQNPDMRLTAIYLEIVQMSGSQIGSTQVDQAIRSSLETAWKNRNKEKWDYFFSEQKMGKKKRPTNYEFIAEMACIMELWLSKSKEVSYGAE